MKLTPSQEAYLHTVCRLGEAGDTVLQRDVAQAMGRSKPSVSRAVGLLRRRGLLAPGRALTLTPAALLALGLPREEALAGAGWIACRLEGEPSERA
ncbi:metal-dependent transcriptional regulator [uncultured Oscillibacter sp.]|uniref:metal-dependent transcriptional regulator n=1 Tax=uncultured Oscillibacter sp. TaxID=876091 RepID=UPI0025FBC18A|nr:MarR family transcriptional regulator [uncultured Oscillibacter sp.]